MSELDDLHDQVARSYDMIGFAAQMRRHREILGLEKPRAHCPSCTCKEHP